jgi:hypothetical protein
MSNDYIGWFSALKHILKGHVGLWNGLGDFYMVFLELSCIMWMLESLEFRRLGFWSCIVQHALLLLDLLCAIFVFCLIWLGLQVGTRGGVVVGCKHIAITNGQIFLRLGFNSLSNACNYSVIIVKKILPLINSNSQIMLCTFVWSPKVHSWFSTIANHTTKKKKPIYSTLEI